MIELLQSLRLTVPSTKSIPRWYRHQLSSDGCCWRQRTRYNGRRIQVRDSHTLSDTRICSKRVAWGTFKSDPDLHFFLGNFHDMDKRTPRGKNFLRKASTAIWRFRR